MTVPVNIKPTPLTDGIPYCTAAPLTPSEADLGGGAVGTPVAVVEGQSLVAVVKLSINGYVTAQSSVIVLQTDLNGDGTWIDLAWLVWSGNQGTATFVMSAGAWGTFSGAFQQSRQAGAAPQPQSSGGNVCPLGGRVRFVGFSQFAGGSSSIAGAATVVSVTITYKLVNPR